MTAAPVTLHDDPRGEGPAIVILHGLFGCGNNWGRYIRNLAAHWRVHAPDLRNHGQSPEAEPMTYEAMAEDVIALLNRAGHDRAVIIGHSMGGKVAMTLALNHPGRVAGLVIVDIAPITYGHEHGALIWAMQSLDDAAMATRRDADRALSQKVPETEVRQFLLTNLERAEQGWRWRLPLATLAEAMSAIDGFPELDGQWPGPTLAIYGGRSECLNSKLAQRAVTQCFPAAEIQAIPEAGHFVHVEVPERFTNILTNWLDAQGLSASD